MIQPKFEPTEFDRRLNSKLGGVWDESVPPSKENRRFSWVFHKIVNESGGIPRISRAV